MQPTIIESRLTGLRQALMRDNFDAMLVLNEANVTYMSGYTNHDAFLFISGAYCGAANTFITDFRYTEQAAAECPEYTVMLYRDPHPTLPQRLAELCADYGVKRLAFEGAYISFERYSQMCAALSQVEFLPSENLIENLRYFKDAPETERLRTACSGTDKVFADICAYIKPGLTEKDVEWALLQSIHAHGFEPSFSFIVVSGARGSLPHGIAGEKKLESGEFLTMDFGCMYQGYHADMTRTVFIGQPNAAQRRLYDTVFSANKLAKKTARAGLKAQELDAAVRDFITAEGYGENFGHGLGHGVGLDIHERPFLSRISPDTLEKGCIITLEPGIYLPGKCGIRIEDTVYVNEDGCENLFSAPQELICL